MRATGELLRQGLLHHRAGRLAEAELLYKAALNETPDYPDALHLLGVLADARGDHSRAVALISQALHLQDSAQFHCNLSMALSKLGRDNEAMAAASRALELRPNYPEALNNTGVALEALGRPADAEIAYRQAVAARSDYAEAWNNLGNALRQLRRNDEAITAYEKAVAVNPAFSGAHLQRAQLLREHGRLTEAASLLRREITLHPDEPTAHINLAATLIELDRSTTASPEAHSALGNSFQNLGRLAEAEAACRRALALRPDYAEAACNLGNVLRERGELQEAESFLRRAVALRPADTGAYNNLAIVLQDQARIHEAVAVLDLAMGLQPDDAEIHHHRALLLLLQGRLVEGFAEYERRFATKQGRADQRNFEQPLWSGEQLSGSTVLLHAEQGFGDTIQFARYVPLVAQRCGEVVLEVQAPLVALLRSVQRVARVIARGEKLPEFDAHAPLLSLPRAIGTTMSTIPTDVPYLAPPHESLARWRTRLPYDDCRRVGIVWAGHPGHLNDRRRSVPFLALAPLWEIPKVRWASLQVGPRAADLHEATEGLIDNLAPALDEFVETAAAVLQLDLVITADTAVAHLAGALGVPTWVMLPFVPDWRWLRAGDRSPWYPTLRLFRQGADRSWTPVVDAVAQAIRNWTARPLRTPSRSDAPDRVGHVQAIRGHRPRL